MAVNEEFIQVPVSCGVDVHKKEMTACLLIVDEEGRLRKTHKKFSTVTAKLEEFRDWLISQNCHTVAVESTGVYWKPLFNILEEASIKMILANARHVKNLPGRKTDMSDAEWLATLLRNGLIRGSFIPPRPIRELRDLTRYRIQLIQDQTKVKNRTHKLLEDVNIKLSGVVSDMFGVSGLSMLRRIAKGGLEDPSEIASMAVGILKRKFTQLTEAAYGRLSEHHCIVLQHLLDQYDASQSSIKTIEALIEEKAKPYQQHINLLCTIPGIGWHSAVAILAETGVDMCFQPTDISVHGQGYVQATMKARASTTQVGQPQEIAT